MERADDPASGAAPPTNRAEGDTREPPSAGDLPSVPAERKQVTVLYADLAGYTALSGRLDPEELKELMLRLFALLSEIVERYQGFLERYLGDAVLAVFGVPKTHEDDAVRAVRAAQEMHAATLSMSPELEARVGLSLALHSGIESGLVVTGGKDVARGLHGIVGDAVNTAARLAELARPGEILVGLETHKQTYGCFDFEELPKTEVKGKERPVRLFRVKGRKPVPRRVRNLSGIRTELVGRGSELGELLAAGRRLAAGAGAVVGVRGEAGTGKSRLVEEFRATLDLGKARWLEGHAFPYAQNTPYFLIIQLLGHAFEIGDGDPPAQVNQQILATTRALPGFDPNLVPYLGSLFALHYPELQSVGPELWKSRLREAVGQVLLGLGCSIPTIVCLEDLHWADPSTIELLRDILVAERYPLLFVCLYRPTIELSELSRSALDTPGCREIRLHDLSPEHAQDMLQSLLRSQRIPIELRRFVQERVGGNPFFLEEVVNSLIEAELLVRGAEGWQLSRPIAEGEVSPNIHGLIAARLDRLGNDSKRLLQEASVFGLSFLGSILRRISGVSDLDRCLSDLEQLDLVRLKTGAPEVEYVFKHVLIQEVVYHGILKKERFELHARAARVIEELFRDRLTEFCETLAYHYSQAGDDLQAVFYLMKSGDKAIKHHAVEEADRYHEQAFKWVKGGDLGKPEQQALLIDLLNQWALVFYYRGDFKGLEQVLGQYLTVAEALRDDARLGMLHAWYGFALFCLERIDESYRHLAQALALGERSGNQRVIASACTWLTWTCADLGLFSEGVAFGERGNALCSAFEGETIQYFQSLGGMGFNHFCSGDSLGNFRLGRILLDYAARTGSVRSTVVGHISIGHAHFVAGNIEAAIPSYQAAIRVARDPFYLEWPRLFLGMCLAQTDRIDESEQALRAAYRYGKSYGCESISSPAQLFLGLVLIRRGRMAEGLRMIEEKLHDCSERRRVFGVAWVEYMLGRVFLELARREQGLSWPTLVRNLGFLLRHLPTARRRALRHLEHAVEAATKIEANGVLGQAYLDLGRLHCLRGDPGAARHCFERSAEAFSAGGATVYLEQARSELRGLT